MNLPDSTRKEPRPALTAGRYSLLALGYLALVLYGSLVPFRFEALPFEEALDRFRALPYFALGIESRSDWVANLLLFVPLAFLTMGALCVDRRGRTILAAAVVLPACVALSLAIEFVQLYFPPHTTSLNDVVAESLGGLAGVVMWAVGGQRLTDRARRLWAAGRSTGLAAQLLPAYLFVLVLIHVMPLDLTLSPVEFYHKYREGRVRLVPFTGWDAGGLVVLNKLFWTAVYFLPGGLLLSYLPGAGTGDWRCPRGTGFQPVRASRQAGSLSHDQNAGTRWQSWLRVLVLGLVLAGLVEFLQLFVYTRYFETTDILIGGLAVLGGWAAGLAWRQRQGDRETRRPGDKEREGSLGLRVVLLLAWLAVAVFVSWRPFDFVTDPETIATKASRLSLTPFADYYAGTDYNAFDQFLHKTLLFLPLGALLVPPGGRVLAGGAVLLAAALVAGGLEAGQLLLPERYPSLTDVVVQSLGALVGFLVAQRVRRALAVNEGAEGKNRELCR